jgi:integrase/recombinase XerD
MAAYQAALGKARPLNIGERSTKPGTIDALIVDYYRSEAFTRALAPASQQMRRNILERFRAVNGGNLVVRLQREHVVAQIKGRAPYAQRNWLKTLRGLMLFAIAENYRGDDPTAGVRPVKVRRTRGHMTWEADQIAAYRSTHALGSMARLALELLLNVAARRGDAHTLGLQNMKSGKIEWRPRKTSRSTGKVMSIRILPELQAALDAMTLPRDAALAFLLNDYGKPFASAAAFGNKFADWCRAAGLKPVLCDDGRVRSYRAHGLRKAACKALAHAGCTGPEIMAVSGHSSLTQVQVYIDDVEQDRMAEAAITKLEQKRKIK